MKKTKVLEIIVIIFVSIACVIEISIGYLQLSGCIQSNHSLYRCTGSFPNPGPFGGFLAVCTSLTLSYYLFGRRDILKKISLTISLLSFPLLIVSQSRAAILCLCISVFVMSMKKIEWRIYLSKHLLHITVLLLLLGGALYLIKKPSADGRFFMNRISLRIINKHILTGVGKNRFAGAYGEEQSQYFRNKMETDDDCLDWNNIAETERIVADCPDKAFNDILQIGVERGGLTMSLFIVAVCYLIISSYKSNGILCYGLISYMVFSFFSYPMSLPETFCLLCLLIVTGSLYHCFSGHKLFLVDCAIISTAIILLISEINDRHIKKSQEKIKREIVWAYDIEDYESVVACCESLCTYDIDDVQLLYMYGHSLNKVGKYEKSDSVLELGSKISSSPMFWNVMGNNSISRGYYREAEERYKHAFYMVPNRLYPLTLLAKLYHTEKDTVRFLKMAEIVETFVPKIENYNIELLRTEIKEIKDEYNIMEKNGY